MKRVTFLVVAILIAVSAYSQNSVTTQYTTVNVDNLRQKKVVVTRDSIVPEEPVVKPPKVYEQKNMLFFNYGIGGGGYCPLPEGTYHYPSSDVVNSLGMTYARVKRFGFYGSAMVGIRPYRYYRNRGYYSDTYHFGYFALTLGGVMEMPCQFPIYLYLGGGFSIADYWNNMGGGALETGVMGRYKKLTFSLGYSACIGSGKYSDEPLSWHIAKIGIGYAFDDSKKKNKAKHASYVINDTSAPIGQPVAQDRTNVTFPDRNFMKACISRCDTNDDNILSESEILAVTDLDVSQWGIKDLTGTEKFTNLKTLNASGNYFTTADLSENLQLKDIKIYSRRLQTVYVSKQSTNVAIDIDPSLIVLK